MESVPESQREFCTLTKCGKINYILPDLKKVKPEVLPIKLVFFLQI